jgi:hypothetical protein
MTPEIFEEFAERDDFLGYGYLGNRDGMSDRVRARVDRAVLKAARELRWTREMFFHWTNSKMGRWYAEDSGEWHRDSNAQRDFDEAVRSMRGSVAVFEMEIPDTWALAQQAEAIA